MRSVYDIDTQDRPMVALPLQEELARRELTPLPYGRGYVDKKGKWYRRWEDAPIVTKS